MERISKYQILGELGKGGFGTVYRANDPGMGRVVAIKVLKAQDDPELGRRFQSEARLAASLRHPNIVIVHDFGEENGRLYLVMEYLDGTTIGDLIAAKTPLPTTEKLTIMLGAALGLKAAHERGILHRDVKPANIMRLSDGSVKLMDFGIARALTSEDTRLTQTGLVIGTPAYMAPEQFTGEGETDALCDIWAYGVVLYEFLTGTNPFYAPSLVQISYRLATVAPPALGDYVPGLPARLEEVMRRLLSKTRADRYQSMEDVCFDLEAILLELRQPEIDRLIADGEELIAGRHLDEAQSVVRRVLEMDRSNAWARQRRGQIQEIARIRARVKELIEQATRAGAEAEAAACLQEALQLDPSNNKAQNRLSEIRASQECTERVRAEGATLVLQPVTEQASQPAPETPLVQRITEEYTPFAGTPTAAPGYRVWMICGLAAVIGLAAGSVANALCLIW
jgi:serine/threonine protein kinase